MQISPSLSETDDSAERYRQDGVLLLRGVFDAWVEPLRAGVEALMANPSPLERTVRPADGSAPFFQDLCNWQRIPEFEAKTGIKVKAEFYPEELFRQKTVVEMTSGASDLDLFMTLIGNEGVKFYKSGWYEIGRASCRERV